MRNLPKGSHTCICVSEFDVDAHIRRIRENPFRVVFDPLTGAHVSTALVVPDGWGQAAPDGKDPDFDGDIATGPAPDDDLVREYVLVRSQIKQLQGRERELREILTQLDKTDADQWETSDGFAIRIRRLRALRIADREAFEEYATDTGIWPQVGTINVSRISAWYRRNPAIADEWPALVEPYEQLQFWTRGPPAQP